MSPVAFVAVFGAGVASFLSPCVAPLVPAYLGMMAGSTAERTQGAVVRATVGFVAGFSAVFAAFGALAGLLGSSLDVAQVWIQRIGGIAVIGFGLLMLGVLRGRLLSEWHAVRTLPVTGSRFRPVVMGVAFGAAWTPCVGPFLGAALVVAARSGDVAVGAALLATYALGVGTPFVIASLTLEASPGLSARLRRSGPVIERVSGVLIVALGLLLLTGQYGWLSGAFARLFPNTGAA